ncbi:MAG: PLP-dependent aminotransferase family protein [candidate division Zixibacteria bacterium]|nr:PLP-dependent aminotransferase family protein [candidate division Zixibacteria bacterium]
MATLKFSSLAGRLRRSEIRELLKVTLHPDTISFAGGLPDPAIFPYQAVEAASQRVIKEQGRRALQYSPTEGEPFLREQLSAFMQRQGDIAKPEDIIVVSSSQQALDLLGKIFIDPGDPVIVERPTYLGTIQAFRAFGADFCGVEMDDDGIIPEELEKTIVRLQRQGRKPKFIYLIPDFQNPAGVTLSMERRKRVLEIASRYDLLIAEDSPYRELRFRGEMLPSLYAMDTEGRVLLMKTLSKMFCPGFRLGWMTGPAEVLDKIVMAKQMTDLCTSAYTSILTGFLIQDGHIERQIEISKNLYIRKAEVMLNALEKYMPAIEGLSWSKPDGGMFLWVRLPEYMDTAEMITEAVKLKVVYVVGTGFFADGSGHNAMRLNYSYPTEEKIVEGVQRLAQVIKSRVRDTSKKTTIQR